MRLTATLAIVGLLALVAGLWVSGGFATGDSEKVVLSDPDAGKSDAVRLAHQAAGRLEWQARYEGWKQGLDLSTIGLSSLPHVELMVDSNSPPPSFEEAVTAASQVVVGTVDSLQATVWSGTRVTIRVDRTVKGSQGDVLTVAQTSSVEPTVDWLGAVIADAPGGPLLLPGIRVMLVLNEGVDDIPYPQPFSGVYYLTPSGVESIELNPFRQTVDGLSEAELVARAEAVAN